MKFRQYNLKLFLVGAIISFLVIFVKDNQDLVKMDDRLTEPFIALKSIHHGVSKNIVIVMIDEETLADYDHYSPLPKELIIKLVKDLTAKNVGMIGLLAATDFHNEEWRNFKIEPEERQALQKVVTLSRNPGFAPESVNQGIVKYQLSSNNIVRKAVVFPKNNRSFAQAVIHRSQLTFPLQESEGEIADVLYYGKPFLSKEGSHYFPTYYPDEIPQISEKVLKDKIVLIGTAAPWIEPPFNTPLRLLVGEGGREYSVEIQANVIESLILGDKIIRLPVSVSIVILFIFCMFVLGLPKLTKPASLYIVATLGLSVLIYFCAYLIFSSTLLMLPLMPLNLAIAVALSVGLYFKWEDRKQKLEQIGHSLALKTNSLENLEKRLKQITCDNFLLLEEERKRIASEIHDDIGQTLTLLNFDLHNLKGELPKKAQDTKSNIDHMMERIVQANHSLKTIIGNLQTQLLEDAGLESALEILFKEYSNKTGIKSEFVPSINVVDLNNHKSVLVYRIVQELMTNTLKYSSASKIRCRLEEEVGSVKIYYADNGKGIAKKDFNKSNSYGLKNMEERILLIRGKFRVRGIDGVGTAIKVVIPL